MHTFDETIDSFCTADDDEDVISLLFGDQDSILPDLEDARTDANATDDLLRDILHLSSSEIGTEASCVSVSKQTSSSKRAREEPAQPSDNEADGKRRRRDAAIAERDRALETDAARLTTPAATAPLVARAHGAPAGRQQAAPRYFTKEEDAQLHAAVAAQHLSLHYVRPSWSAIALALPGRDGTQCRQRWQKIVPGLKKGRWAPEEDTVLAAAAARVFGEPASVVLRSDYDYRREWAAVAAEVPGRSSSQCRYRWMKYLCQRVVGVQQRGSLC